MTAYVPGCADAPTRLCHIALAGLSFSRTSISFIDYRTTAPSRNSRCCYEIVIGLMVRRAHGHRSRYPACREAPRGSAEPLGMDGAGHGGRQLNVLTLAGCRLPCQPRVKHA